MSIRNLDDNPKIKAFYGAAMSLRSAAREVMPRLTPVVPAPRDSDPTIGDPLPEHGAADRAASLPPPRSAWASSDADEDASDDGGPGR